jgi:hypothetical protein
VNIYGIFKNYPKFHSIKEEKIIDPKKVEALVNMLVPTTPKRSKFSMGWKVLHVFYKKNWFYYVTNNQTA